jgi:hypothetical protein
MRAKRTLGVKVAVGAAALAVGAGAVVAGAGPAFAQSSSADAMVTVVHGIPNVPVDVYANGDDVLSDFTFKSIKTLEIPAGTYTIDLRKAGSSPTSAPILSGTVMLTAGERASVVAALSPSGQPELETYKNPSTSPASGDGEIVVRHDAEAPAVEVVGSNPSDKIISSLTNPDQASLQVPAGNLSASVKEVSSGKTLLGPTTLDVQSGKVLILYAVGDPAQGTFTVLTQSYSPSAPATTSTTSTVPSTQTTPSGSMVPMTHTGKPWSGWLYWAVIGEVALGGGVAVLAGRRLAARRSNVEAH